MKPPAAIVLFLFTFLFASITTGLAQQKVKKELDVGFASLESVRPILKKVLSPRGQFVLLPGKGTVLVIDDITHIAAAEAALARRGIAQSKRGHEFRFSNRTSHAENDDHGWQGSLFFLPPGIHPKYPTRFSDAARFRSFQRIPPGS